MVILHLFLFLAFGQEVEEPKFVKERVGACLKLVRLKMIAERDQFDRIFTNIPKENEERIVNRVVGDMILECAEKISADEAIELLEQGDNAKYEEKHHSLMTWNEAAVDLEFQVDYTPEQIMIFTEVVEQTNAMKNTINYDENEEDEPVEDRQQKLAACFVLARFLIKENMEETNELLAKYPKLSKEKAMNKIVGDMLEDCLYNIPSESALKILEEKENASVLPEHREYLK